jgi:hypothetical protein
MIATALVRAVLVVGLGALLLYALLMVALAEPWPISLRHGPDTPYARSVVERHFYGADLAGIRKIYAWDSWAGPGESILYVRFEYDSLEAALRFLGTQHTAPLRLVPEEQVASLPIFDGPAWWPVRDSLVARREVFRSGAALVWVDSLRRIVHLQRAKI